MKTIAVITRERNGVSFHRQFVPHINIAKKYPGEFEILFRDGVEHITEAEWERINLIHYSGLFDFQKEDVTRKKGIITVLDKDDYWDIPLYHVKAYEWSMNKYWYRTEISICAADHIICTTPYLAGKVSELNKNVTVIPNAIDPKLKQFQPNEWNLNPDFIRFGWLGGTSHLKDLELMRGSLSKLDKQKEFRRKWQFVLAGMSMTDTELHVMSIDRFTGKQTKVRLPKYETIWGRMERMVTDDYKLLDMQHEYVKYLAKFTPNDGEIMNDKVYKRIWGKDLFNYAKGYNEMDVVMAPLVDDEFNKCKSQLKLIEAGFMGRPVICSDIEPYRLDGLNEENCIFVKGKDPNEWYYKMRKLLLNPELIKEMGANLKRDMMAKYDMEKVNETRVELYRELIDKSRNGNRCK